MAFLNSIFLIILSITILHFPVVSADTLLKGDALDPNDNQQSSGENFTMEFFRLQTFYYLGIGYTDDRQKKVWVANRDTPIIGGTGPLILDDESETLLIMGTNGNPNITLFNATNQFGPGITPRAVLEDSGNFIFYDNATNRILWQSFDYPTDTLLPGMKLGYNLTSGQNWTLTSWLSDQIPASGAFTLRLEQYQNSPQLVIYRRGNVYWSSGSLTLTQERFDGNLRSDASGMYFSVRTMLKLSYKGELIGGGANNVLTPTFCYGYQRDDGCVISALPSCRSRRSSFQLRGGDWTGGLIRYDDSSNISLSDCMERCWNDCSCRGFSTNSNNGTGCFTWGRNAVFTEDTNKPEQGVLMSRKRPKKRIWIWILVSIATLLIAVITCLCYVMIRRRLFKEEEKRKRDDYIHQLTGSASFNDSDELEKGIKDAPDVKIFSLKAILAATDNFSNENKLGRGGYGPVYKGKLFDGRQIAVKRLSKTSGQGISEFKSELILISKLQHTNLVRLYGCCIHQQEKMLIYEFMPNKSLDFFLFADKEKKERINWRMRFNIIEGVAQGLLYLHKYSRMKVIHRDLKVSNVLLDENMNPKIADFGMARIFHQDVTEAITNRVVGTYGYMAPEYAMGGTFSIKSDVFSFGVLILEIVSGKRNSSFYSLDKTLNLVGYAWELWKRETSLELMDESLGESCDLKQLQRTIHVGLLCVQEIADDRPTMQEVISMLNNEIAELPNPKQPAFLTGTQLVEGETKSTDYLLDKNIPVSVNGLTITLIKER